MDRKWILGIDLGVHGLRFSLFEHRQEELEESTYAFQWEDRQKNAERVISKVQQFLEQQKLDAPEGEAVFSLEARQAGRIKEIRQDLEKIGFSPDSVYAISRESAFAHYVMGQEASLYAHRVLLFDFDGKEMYGYRLSHSKKRKPERFEVESFYVGSFTKVEDSDNWGRIIDERFAAIARQFLTKEVVSAVFLTGEGFMEEWLSKSLNVLCSGRRAFIGQNLFSGGCCYYGMRKGVPEAVVCVPETVLFESSILDGSGERPVAITEAGGAWYDTKGEIDLIPERCGKLEIIFTDIFTKEKQVETVDISGLAPRPRKTGRLHVEVEFLGSRKGTITVRDLGFGAFYPASNQVFLKEFALL